MKYFYALFVALLILLSFSSCAVARSLLGWNECAQEGCDRETVDNCNYCGFHCESYFPPADFNNNVDKSIKKQVDRYKTPPKGL